MSRPASPWLIPATLCLTAPFCGGCIVSLINAQYAFADPEPLGCVSNEVRPAPWCDVIDSADGDDVRGPALVVPTAAVRLWPTPIPGFEPIGVRYVVLDLDGDYRPPPQIALPEVAGMTAGQLSAWAGNLTATERADLLRRAREARAGIIARRAPPPAMNGREWGEHVRGAPPPKELLPPSDALVDVVRLSDDALIAAYRLPADVAVAPWSGGDEFHVTSLAIPPPQPPATGPPNPAPYHAAVILPASFETSGGDRAARAAAAVLVSPLAAAYDVVIVGFSLLPLALTVGAVAAVAAAV